MNSTKLAAALLGLPRSIWCKLTTYRFRLVLTGWIPNTVCGIETRWDRVDDGLSVMDEPAGR